MKKKIRMLCLMVMFFPIMLFAQTEPKDGEHNRKQVLSIKDTIAYLNIPVRDSDAVEGSDFVNQITGLALKDREVAIVREILSGNVPSFSRKLRSLKISRTIDSDQYEFIFYTVCDYMAIGSEQDYLYVPMTPSTAQYLADQLNCSLPTSKMVDLIYASAGLKLDPQPIPPSDKMTTVPVFSQHTDSIKQQISNIGYDRSADSIVAGHKKDIIISKKIYSPDRNYDRVVIYGWHVSENNPIQPVYNGHHALYADYSHGVRLISNIATINGDSCKVTDILRDAQLSVLLSREGVINKPFYPASEFFSSTGDQPRNYRIDFELYQNYPNPFNPTTTIKYGLKRECNVNILVYNIQGKLVETLVNDHRSAGYHTIHLHASNIPSGMYFYKIKADNFTDVKKCILMK